MSRLESLNVDRLSKVMLVMFLVVGVIVLRLFYMQVIQHGHYITLAQEGRQGYRELNARRGQIFAKDSHSGDYFVLATNVTLPTVFIDPYLTPDPRFVADELGELLFDEEAELDQQAAELKKQREELPPELSEDEILSILKPKSIDELRDEFEVEVFEKVSSKVRDEIILIQNPEPDVRRGIRELVLSGVVVSEEAIIAQPNNISNREETAAKLAPLVDIPVERLTAILEGKNRYSVLARRIDPDIAEEIEKLQEQYPEQFRGVGLENKTYRYYPEGTLAAQVLGFINNEGDGQYGLEASFNDDLKGTPGVFKAQLDGTGKQITVGDDVVIQTAEDGVDLYLTIDRAVQRRVEEILQRNVEQTQAEAGQIIVMDPDTGAIMAMAHYPSFDPNEYWRVGETELYPVTESEQDDIIKKTYEVGDNVIEETYIVLDEFTDERLQLFPSVDDETGETEYYKYANNVGPAVYRNRVVSDIYEPGSVFKAIAMAIALDASSVTPSTTIVDNGPIKVDEFTIDNAEGLHYGRLNMTQVLEKSNNIGMAFVARRIGRTLFYSYLKDFGLTQLTDIEFLGEIPGQIEKPSRWAESELVTHAFGQGIAITPIQMITAFSAIANDGVLMEPHIVAQYYRNDDLEERKPYAVRQVVSQETAETIKAMLLSVIDNGQGKNAAIPGYTVAGKTGTSQTYRNGKPLEGAGTTITSFAGFAPVDDPAFVILVKIDRPKTSPWASAVAAPVFAEVTEYLLDFYAVPPDR